MHSYADEGLPVPSMQGPGSLGGAHAAAMEPHILLRRCVVMLAAPVRVYRPPGVVWGVLK